MLNPSRLMSFFDPRYNFTLHFLEGQKLIQEIVVIHKLERQGFLFYRDILLSFQPLISFLKPKEGFGIYIDSSSPKFSFKVETNDSGLTRSLLMPEAFSEFPKTFSGQCRVSKNLPGQTAPYTSIIAAKDSELNNLVNEVLKTSYQMNAKVILSQDSDQSILVSKLPHIGGHSKDAIPDISLNEYLKNNDQIFKNIFIKGHNDETQIIEDFEKHGFEYLSGKEVKFHCNCSKHRFVVSILSLQNTSVDAIFDNEESLDVRCDYCGKDYIITKEEVLKSYN